MRMTLIVCYLLCSLTGWAAETPQPVLVADISDNTYADQLGDARAGIDRLLAVDGTAYWTQYSEETAIALWASSDGGTPRLLHDHLGGKLLQMDVHDGVVYYVIDVRNGRNDGESNKNRIRLWRTQGTAATTRLVQDFDVPDNIDGATPRNTGAKLLSIGGALYICVGWTHQDSDNGYFNDWGAGVDQIWRYDGSDGPPQQVVDLEAMGQSLSLATVIYLDGHAYGTAFLDEHGTELVRLDLADPGAGIELVQDIDPGPGSSAPDLSMARLIDGAFYFAANDGEHGLELWRCDGTTTRLVHDIRPGSGSSRPNALMPFGDRIYFAADDGEHGGELWSIDRDGNDARLSLDLNPDGGSLIRPGMRHGDHLYFTAWSAEQGRELYRFDGLQAELAHEFHPGSEGLASTYSSASANMISIGAELFISAEDDGLWYLAPEAVSLVRLGEIAVHTSGTSSLHASDGRLYLPGWTADTGVELYSLPTKATTGDWFDSLTLYGRVRNDDLNNHVLIGGDDPSTAPGPDGSAAPTRRIRIVCERAASVRIDGGCPVVLPATVGGLRIADAHRLSFASIDGDG